MRLVVAVIALLLAGAQLHAQPKYRPFFITDSLDKILPYFRSDIPVWPRSTGNVLFKKDTVYQPVLKVWIIESENYNEPIYAVYTDTVHVIMPDWQKQKNFVRSIEKYGPGKALFFYFRNGDLSERSDINDLRRYGEIPGLKPDDR